MGADGVDSVIPGSPIYYNPKRVRRKKGDEQKHKRKKQAADKQEKNEKIDTYA